MDDLEGTVVERNRAENDVSYERERAEKAEAEVARLTLRNAELEKFVASYQEFRVLCSAIHSSKEKLDEMVYTLDDRALAFKVLLP